MLLAKVLEDVHIVLQLLNLPFHPCRAFFFLRRPSEHALRGMFLRPKRAAPGAEPQNLTAETAWAPSRLPLMHCAVLRLDVVTKCAGLCLELLRGRPCLPCKGLGTQAAAPSLSS